MEKPVEDWTFRDVVEAEERGEELPPEVEEHLASARQRLADLGREIHEGLRAPFGRLAISAREFSDWLESGDPAADYIIAMLPVSYTEDERLAALRRILHRIGPPPSQQKWNRNREVFLAALDDLGTDVHGNPYTRMRFAEQLGLPVVRETIGDLTPGEVRQLADTVEKSFRRTLDRWFRDGLLPEYDWKENRRREVSDSVLDKAQQEMAFNDGPTNLEVEELLAVLTDYEEQVLKLDRQGYSDREIADQLETSEQAISSALSRVRKKIKSASGASD